MISYNITNKKLQKLINKKDTLTKIEFAITIYRKIFKAFYFLCDDDIYLVIKCSHLLKT